MSDTLIEIHDIEVSYGHDRSQTPVLRGINLSVKRGEYVAITGPSGSGKSTLFYILGCLLEPSAGHIVFGGRRVDHSNDSAKSWLRSRSIGFVFQHFHLLPKATVLDNIMLAATYPEGYHSDKSAIRRRALYLTERLGISHLIERLPNELSGGQQQRVAIARALLNGADLILADEPTGSLDSKSAADTLALFDELHAEGKTIVIITHDASVAAHCERVVRISDGLVASDTRQKPKTSALTNAADSQPAIQSQNQKGLGIQAIRLCGVQASLAWQNLRRNRAKSILTMLGIVIGIAAVLTMMTLGQFAKSRFQETFESMGANRVSFRGYPNWELKATDKYGVPFQAFSWHRELLPLRHLFPEIRLISPVMQIWDVAVNYGGKSAKEGIRLLGVNHEYPTITNASFSSGSNFIPYHIENRSQVCLLGSDVASQLFGQSPAIGAQIGLTLNQNKSLACRVIGVLNKQTSAEEWEKPSLQVFIPFTLMEITGDSWSSRIRDVAMTTTSSQVLDDLSQKLTTYFSMKYGNSAKFSMDSNDKLVAQSKQLLEIFALLLAAIAFLALFIGGIGIHNMMLVTVSERLKEIGLRKALGATNTSIQRQILLETLLICATAGIVGLALGLGLANAAIYGAAKFMPNVSFAWTFEALSITISSLSILVVGIISGLTPARRAERLQVIDALRME